MTQQIAPFMTSEEIGHLTQTSHEFVLSRACEQLLKAGIDPNQFWNEYTDLKTGIAGKRLHLSKPECLLVICNDWFSEKAKSMVMEAWNDLEDKNISIFYMQKKLLLSPTIAQLHRLSQKALVDIRSHDELHDALATFSAEIIFALDEGRLHFTLEEDKAVLIGLLTVVVDYVSAIN
ncbi:MULTISPECIES: hypothetical protein [Methylobacter]